MAGVNNITIFTTIVQVPIIPREESKEQVAERLEAARRRALEREEQKQQATLEHQEIHSMDFHAANFFQIVLGAGVNEEMRKRLLQLQRLREIMDPTSFE